MTRLLKTPGSPAPSATMHGAEFYGLVRDGATFRLTRPADLRDGDMVLFNYPDGLGSGIHVEEDARGLCAHIQFHPSMSLRIGLEPLADGEYAFRPDAHHMQMIPALADSGAGVSINRA
jgi:hypothetical protein